jgi:peptidoglycan/xylan/chitin deacetylase (PgdA/CDA1 family)
MNSAVRNITYPVIARSRLPQVLHKAVFPHHLTIVTYHAVVRSPLKVPAWCFLDESLFRSQVNYLKSNFDIIPLFESIERMKKGGISGPTAVITFDDGFQNNYDVAFPILDELQVPATIFLTTGFLNTADTAWFCRLNCALAKTTEPMLQWNGCRFNLSGAGKSKAFEAIAAKLLKFAHPQLLTELRNIILQLREDPDSPIHVGSPYRMLSHEAIARMAGSGLIEFGAHTHTHAILSRLSPRDRTAEIERSIAMVQELTGRRCELFAYPNGRAEDYDTATIAALEACGVRGSVTSIAGPNNRTTPVMELRRYGIGAEHTMAYFQLRVHHFIAEAKRMIQ